MRPPGPSAFAARAGVLEHQEPDSMRDAVQAHGRSWRVPCPTEAEGPARLGMAFVFTADPTRRPLPEWLQGIQPELPRRTHDAVFCDSTTSPCPA